MKKATESVAFLKFGWIMGFDLRRHGGESTDDAPQVDAKQRCG